MRSTLAVLLLAATAAGCAHARKEAPPVAMSPSPPQAVAAAISTPPPAAPPASSPANCQADDQCATSELCLQARCVAIDSTTAACARTSTHFDFDRAVIKESDFPVLQREARCLEAQPAVHLRVEGNCDERGTTAYNLVLGQRRATADQRYLVNLGIPSSRISTVSYGKERPVCRSESEVCWAQNRRDDMVKAQ